jgi:hypothetical protein
VHLRVAGGALIAAHLALVACAEVEPDLVLGTGEIEFTALEEGDELEVIRGPQNGFHVLGAIRTMGIEPGDDRDLASPRNPSVVFTLTTADGTEWQFPDTIVQGLPSAPSSADPWTHEMLNRRVVLDILADDELDSVDGTLAVTLTDADGIVLSDSVGVFLVPSPFNDL